MYTTNKKQNLSCTAEKMSVIRPLQIEDGVNLEESFSDTRKNLLSKIRDFLSREMIDSIGINKKIMIPIETTSGDVYDLEITAKVRRVRRGDTTPLSFDSALRVEREIENSRKLHAEELKKKRIERARSIIEKYDITDEELFGE